MEESKPDDKLSTEHFKVRTNRATSVIVHRVGKEETQHFLAWQQSITRVCREFAGFQATDLYPPTDQQPAWVVLIHFDTNEDLKRWLDSPGRAECMKTLPGGP